MSAWEWIRTQRPHCSNTARRRSLCAPAYVPRATATQHRLVCPRVFGRRYTNANRWADALMKRPEVQRGMLVCRKYAKPWLVDDRFKHLAKL